MKSVLLMSIFLCFLGGQVFFGLKNIGAQSFGLRAWGYPKPQNPEILNLNPETPTLGSKFGGLGLGFGALGLGV